MLCSAERIHSFLVSEMGWCIGSRIFAGVPEAQAPCHLEREKTLSRVRSIDWRS